MVHGPGRCLESVLLKSSQKMHTGAADTGVVSLAVLLPRLLSAPLLPSSEMLTELLICVTPMGSGSSTVTA